jgi:hypothetical protein
MSPTTGAVRIDFSAAAAGTPPSPFVELASKQSQAGQFRIEDQFGRRVLHVGANSGDAILYYKSAAPFRTLTESYTFVYSGPSSVVAPFIVNATIPAPSIDAYVTDLSVSRPGNDSAGDITYRHTDPTGLVQGTLQHRLRTEPYFYRLGHTYRVDAVVDGDSGALSTRIYDVAVGPQAFDLTFKKVVPNRGLYPGIVVRGGPALIEDLAWGPANELPLTPHVARRASDYMGYLGYNAAIAGATTTAASIAFQHYFPLLLIKHVRLSSESRFLPSINAVAKYGINADVLTGRRTTPAGLQGFISQLALPPDAIELWNEPNNAAGGDAYDPMYEANIPPFGSTLGRAFSKSPIWGPSVLPQSDGYPPPSIRTLAASIGPVLTAWNAHAYTAGTPENLGYGAFISNACGASQHEDCGWYGAYNYNDNVSAIIAPTLPGVTTEGAGSYGSYPDICRHTNVDMATQQAYVERGMLYDFKLGHLRIFPYKFIDDGGCSDGFGTYGIMSRLIGPDGQVSITPKPAYVSLVYLDTLLQDRGSTQSTSTPQPLSYALTGAPPDVEELLLAESDGSYRLVLWSDKSLWDYNANGPRDSGAPIPVVGEPVLLRFASPMVTTDYTQKPGTGAWVQGITTRSDAMHISVNPYPQVVVISQATATSRVALPENVPTPGPVETPRAAQPPGAPTL